MSSISDALASRLVETLVDFQRFESGLRRELLGRSHVLGETLEASVRRVDPEGVRKAGARVRRTEALLEAVQKDTQRVYSAAIRRVRSEIREFARLASIRIVDALNQGFEADLIDTKFSIPRVDKILDEMLIVGAPLNSWWKQLREQARWAFLQQIRIGSAARESNERTIERLRGRRLGARRALTFAGDRLLADVYQGGAIRAVDQKLETFSATLVFAVVNTVMEAIYRENTDVFAGRQAVAVMDGRKNLLCVARAGSAWDFEGEPLPESPSEISWPGPPPWHPRCRTIMVPIPKSAPLAEDVDFAEWLTSKSTSFQQRILGKKKHKLWRDGQITIAQLVDQTGHPLTLSQLERVVDE